MTTCLSSQTCNYSVKLCLPLDRAQFAWIIPCNIYVNSIKSTYAIEVTLTTCCFNQFNPKSKTI